MKSREAIERFVGKRGYINHPEYRGLMIEMRFEDFSADDVAYFDNLYFSTKDIFSRKQILNAFVLRCLQYDLKDFFLSAFKKERYLDMRLTALRGYAAYAIEKEIAPLMKRFHEILIKIPEHTPYNYQEYEMLRSPFGLPYLVERYGYSCFKETMAQLDKQYDDMPDACKGFFTLDENGIHISLLTPGECSKRLDKLFGRK
ncbi:hypothetical protein SOASR030_36560 [Leminorella grimontii]|uniref:Uncharacterized protein n=1 Tax=Leminorella grimontii TaxID=82981 RepID=A0AAV5N8V0_9GAMM|nr:hypothetical protein [Leminorella grimontii]KFC92768.1 hypothetical protein GLGR_3643 [Leminorella grimontii ATCC 33999 = DSM 5078]GKX57544.1 hypothetical protein SOASR030_36560 [Leminorella grimontii]VFS62385.1 Uncharacterised protein [Leminorella grimontii]